MFHRVKAAILLVLLFVASTSMAFEKQQDTKKESTKSGPAISVSEQELEHDVTDITNEEGLQRLGNFGKLHLFGYGEMHYNNLIGSGTNQIDFHRLVIGVGYDFTDNIKFRTEVDFEHAFKEPELEYAYVDYLAKPWVNFRAGSILVPMGTINQNHEPPLFYSVERPQLYHDIIPSSWQEGGVGMFGNFPGNIDYQLYLMSSLEAVTIEDGAITRSFTGSEGFHDSFGHVGEQPARDFAAAGRVQYKGVPGLRLGTSFFLGNTGQGNSSIGGGFLTMVEGDAKYTFEGIELEGQLAFTHLRDAENINNYMKSFPGGFTNDVATQMLGWYVEGAYHVLHHLKPESKKDVVTFIRYESTNTNFSMPVSSTEDPANDRRSITTGISYLPIPQVALKADYQFNWNKANSGTDQFNLGLGFYY